MRDLPISVHIVTIALLVNMILAFTGGPEWLIWIMFLAGPFLMMWMVLHVLKDQTMPMRDLEQNEHWGYQDRPDLRPAREVQDIDRS